MWTEVDHETMYLLILWQALLNGTAVITKLPLPTCIWLAVYVMACFTLDTLVLTY